MSGVTKATPKPAPPLIASQSHAACHLLPRRFIGPLPEVVVNSTEVLDAKSRLNKLKSKAVKQGGKVRQKLQKEDEERRESKKRKHRKDVWYGSSFDIGREFNLGEAEDSTGGRAEDMFVPDGAPEPTLIEAGPSSRPEVSTRRSTGSSRRPDLAASATDSFHTARTHLERQTTEPEEIEYSVETLSTRKMSTGSMAPLVPASSRRLKSVLRGEGSRRAGKTVQFPANPSEPLAGDASPADPHEVLDRSGGQVLGTSAGVVQAATGAPDGQPEEEDDIILPGSVLMRGE